ncbi:MAG TPA: hypothetical protein VFU46_03550, partial [Gemmatimonadales bacterium]|nr:hypothetical protein [Gemmatimonadales bacterium]
GDLRSDRLSTIGDQIGATLPTLFPALPPSGLEAGREWTDTAHRSLRADAFDATEQAITSYRAAPGDGGSIMIQSRTTFQRNGTSGQATQPMEMTSGGIREGVYRFGSGAVLAGEGTDSSEITITVPAVGQTVPVSQRGRWRVEKLR